MILLPFQVVADSDHFFAQTLNSNILGGDHADVFAHVGNKLGRLIAGRFQHEFRLDLALDGRFDLVEGGPGITAQVGRVQDEQPRHDRDRCDNQLLAHDV